MVSISSHRDHRSSKMRFLIVSAVLACAAAAPSHLLAPVILPAPVPLAYASPIPTLSPGDVQAAAIDAQVKAQDLAIAAADKARELSENASENLTEKLVSDSDLVKENNQEAFWSVQEKQWQALDALKTAEAKLDGAIASNAPVLAKNAVLSHFVAAVPAIAPITLTPGIVSPALKTVEAPKLTPFVAAVPAIAPITLTPGIVSPELKTVEAPKEELKTEENVEALTKTAEEKKDEKDSVAIEASKENLEAKPQLAPFIAPIAIQPYSYPLVAPIALSPVLKYATYPQVGFAPTIIKTAW